MVAATPTSPRKPHPRRRGGRDSADGQVLGAMLVAGGVGWFLQQVGLAQLSLVTMLSGLLIILGVGLVLTARRAGGVGLVVVGLLMTVVLASVTAVDIGVLQRGAGERTFTPSLPSELRDRYQLGAGSLTLDLTDVDAEALSGRRIHARVGVGELVVVLPPRSAAAVRIKADARAGEVDLFGRGRRSGGTNVTDSVEDPEVPEGSARLALDLDVGLGTVEVVRPPG